MISNEMIPKYYRIFEELYRRIEDGDFKEGDRFPSDTELVKKYNVSRGTIREALKLLFQRGLLVRQQGKGTFVTHRKIEQNAGQLMGFSELMRRNNMTPSAKLIEITTKEPGSRIKSILKLDDGEKIVKIERLRFGNDIPLIIERSYYVYRFFRPLLSFDLENASIYELLYQNTDYRLGEARQEIEAIAASQKECGLLQVQPGDPLLQIKRLIQLKDGSLFQYSEDIYRSDKLNFVVTTHNYDESHNEFGLPLNLIKDNDLI